MIDCGSSGVHVPVLVPEMLEALRPHDRGIYFDGTLGAGGYAQALLDASAPDGVVVAVDLDPEAIDRSRKRLAQYGERCRIVHGGFHDAARILEQLGIPALDGAVLDLGMSSDQVNTAERGFSFQREGPLDMRFDTTGGEDARTLLSQLSLKKLEEILATYGEERYCTKLARGILQAVDRETIHTTADLAELVARILGRRRERIHPATRTFQALRIAVNRELENLDGALRDIPNLLKSSGRFCVVSYHSLEDRMVKLAFREFARDRLAWSLITRKPIRPSDAEKATNPRARSARMRVLEAGATST
jgi:16S rRNA (cytosine1402-N4)-methyltransferase